MEISNDKIVHPSIAAGPVPLETDNSYLRRHNFPKHFMFGTATSAYQVEGGYAKGGKGLSIWDEFATSNPELISDGSNGNVACDMYNRYKEDIEMMKKMGLDSYRFSISWARILPSGRCSGGINREGIAFYNEVIDSVVGHGMTPFVTLHHFDTPYSLEKEYGGFLNKKIRDDFGEYAELCFTEFGDRVKYWTTINEPWTYCVTGYVDGVYPPAHKIPAPAPPQNLTASPNSLNLAQPWEAYTVATNMLLAHAQAVHLYRTKFQEIQEGKIGIVLISNWFVPRDEASEADKAAAHRAIDFMLGWFLEPVLYGEYPKSMIEFVGVENMACFTDEESNMLRGCVDFIGLNYYTAQYVAYHPHPPNYIYGYFRHLKASFSYDRDGQYIGEPSGSSWLYVVPSGIYYLLDYVFDRYKELKELYITENGVSSKNDIKLTAKKSCNDIQRTKHIQDHLANILKVMNEKKLLDKVKGYYHWSWCDNYEWNVGYTVRFGLIYIDYMNDLTRYPKDSATWFAKFLKRSDDSSRSPFLSKM